MDKFEITKAGIVAAANVCPDAQRVLKELFPEAFKEEEPEWVDCTSECGVRLHKTSLGFDIELYRRIDNHTIGFIWADGSLHTNHTSYRVTTVPGGYFRVERKLSQAAVKSNAKETANEPQPA